MAANSGLTIVNEALIRLGVPPIGSLSDQSAQALAAETLFANITDELLADHPWLFATREKDLASLVVADGDKLFPDFPYVYQLPPDSLRVLGLDNYGPFRVAGDQLYAEVRTARVVYIYRAPVSLWPPYFVEVAAKELAAAFALTLTDSSGRQANMAQQAARSRQRARSIDGQQQPTKVLQLLRAYTRRTINPLVGS